jgi:Uma2 family endonuclease
MTERRQVQATPDNWWSPPPGGWTYDQVKDLDLPFDWELVDGVIVVRGMTPEWHDMVKGELFHELRSLRQERYRIRVERCVMVNANTVIKPDVVVFDGRDLDLFTLECVPAQRVKLVVEVVSPGSRVKDRATTPALMATAGVPNYWRVERDKDNLPVVHEYWLHHEKGEYISALERSEHHDKLVTERPFPVEIDLRKLIEF